MSNVFGNSFSTNYMLKTAMGWDMQISNATQIETQWLKWFKIAINLSEF